jgi:hypothetical protein
LKGVAAMMMKTYIGAIFVISSFLMMTRAPLAFAYGGGGGGLQRPSCIPPSFSEESPQKDAVLPAFSEFSFVASPNTKRSTVVVKINGQVTDVMINEKRYGGLLVTGRLPDPVTEEGFVTIGISAASTPDCIKNYVYRVKISGEEKGKGAALLQ